MARATRSRERWAWSGTLLLRCRVPHDEVYQRKRPCVWLRQVCKLFYCTDIAKFIWEVVVVVGSRTVDKLPSRDCVEVPYQLISYSHTRASRFWNRRTSSKRHASMSRLISVSAGLACSGAPRNSYFGMMQLLQLTVRCLSLHHIL